VIEAVIWDFGGVFTTSPFEAFARYERERRIPYAGNFGPLPVEGSKAPRSNPKEALFESCPQRTRKSWTAWRSEVNSNWQFRS
jgi:hypothetical protein